MLRPVVSLFVEGEAELDHGLGCVLWSPAQLLADLELRLGLWPADTVPALRAQAYAARVAAAPGFAARAMAIDPLGTATAILGWRDELRLAGWQGNPIPGGGPRLELLAAAEAPLPPGLPERLQAVLAALETSPYAGVQLLDELALWPAAWQAILQRLGAIHQPTPAGALADARSDLGRLQRGLPGVTGDGSLVLLRAETSHEVCDAAAALVAQASDVAVIRGGEGGVLDTALARHGVATLGASTSSAWRPALQVLPLTVELLFGPRDPYRALELLSLPISPFGAITRRVFSSALGQAPGIGGKPWSQAKDELRRRLAEDPQRAESQLERIAAWFEEPASERVDKATVIRAVTRVSQWLHGRLARTPEDATLGAAIGQASAFAATLQPDPRADFDVVDLRLLLDSVSRRALLPLSSAQADRASVVDGPAGLRRPHATILWAHFVAGSENLVSRPPWRSAELAALAAQGVRFPEPGALLQAEVSSWRRVITLASERLILAVPGRAAGAVVHPHPLWSEIVATLRLEPADVARLTRLPQGLPREPLPPLSLPAPRPVWRTPPITVDRLSATGLDTLTGCPLSYVLKHKARLDPGALASVPVDVQLHGSLGHRLIEELHTELPGDPSNLRQRAAAVLDRLIATEAASLTLPGASFEARQVRNQLLDTVVRLVELLEQGGYAIAGVEQKLEHAWNGVTLHGRLDLRLRDQAGKSLILDLKWRTGKHHTKLITDGHAVQLAVYAALLAAEEGGTLAPAGYFSLLKGAVLSTDARLAKVPTRGPTLDDTLRHVGLAMDEIMGMLREGIVVPTGLWRPADLRQPFGDVGRTCRFCSYDALCGKRWEDPS